jgi:hypothetical protein
MEQCVAPNTGLARRLVCENRPIALRDRTKVRLTPLVTRQTVEMAISNETTSCRGVSLSVWTLRRTDE